MIGRLLCWLGRHKWRMRYVPDGAGSFYVVFVCKRCGLKQYETHV